MNTDSSLFREISPETMEKIINRHLHTSDIRMARLMEGGLFNTTYCLVCGPDLKKVILRLGPVNRHLLLGFENHLMEAESLVYELFSGCGIPCPRVLAVDTTRSLLDRDFMLTEYVDSTVMSRAGLSDEEKKPLYREAGRFASVMHTITSGQFGCVYDCMHGRGFSSWFAFLYRYVSDILNRSVRYSVFTRQEADTILSLFVQRKSLFDDIHTPCLIHTDLWEGNLLLEKSGDSWHLAAVIDADRAIWGDPDFEMASGWMITDSFLEGYKIDRTAFLSPERKERREYYGLIYDLIDTYVGKAEYNQPEQYKNGCSRVMAKVLYFQHPKQNMPYR